MRILLKIHEDMAYTLLAVNLLSGILLLIAWKMESLRDKKWLKIVSYIAHGFVAFQIVTGMIMLVASDLNPPASHIIYGVIAFTIIGILHSFRSENRTKYLVWGFGGILVAVVAFRAIWVVTHR